MIKLHECLNHYVRDHARVRHVLTDILRHHESAVSVQDKLEILNSFFSYAKSEVEAVHELSEELFLFKAISKKAAIRSGGPMCMLYFDIHCANHPFDQAARVTGQKRMQPTTGNVANHLKPFVEENSPVCIPLSDHLACNLISTHAVHQISTAPTTPESAEKIFELAQTYLKILLAHFEKEENCLFPMTQSLLNESELSDCAAQSVIWEVNIRAAQSKIAEGK